MALAKQNIDIPVNPSIDTKTDSFLVNADGSERQENVRFFKTGANVKRTGFAPLQTGTSGFGFKRIITDNNQLFCDASYGETYQFLGDWKQVNSAKGTQLGQGVAPLQLKRSLDFGIDEDCFLVDSDSFGQYKVAGFASGADCSLYIADGNNFKKISITSATPQRGFTCRLLTNGTTVRVGVILSQPGTSFAYLYSINGDLLASTGFIGNQHMVSSDVTDNRDRMVCFLGQNSNDAIRVLNFDGTTSSVATASILAAGTGHADIAVSSGTKAWIANCYDGSNNASVRQVDVATGTIDWTATNALSSAIGSDDPARISITESGDFLFVACSFTDLSEIRTRVFLVVKSTQAVTVLANESWHIIASRPIFENDSLFIPMIGGASAAPANNQDGVYSGSLTVCKVENLQVRQVATGLYAQAVTQRSFNNGLSRYAVSSVSKSGDEYFFAVRRAGPVVRISSTQVTLSGNCEIFSINLQNTDQNYGKPLTAGTALINFSGASKFYDGFSCNSLGFHFDPVVSLSASTTGGTIAAGTYQYSAVFEFYDTTAGVTRSAESNIASVTTTGSTSSVTVSVRVCQQISGAKVKIYRTTLNGSIRRFISEGVVPDVGGLWPNPSVFQLLDIYADADIPAASPLVYTSGGVLSHRAPPPASHACVHNNRVFVVAADQRDEVYYSNKFLPGELPSFSELLFLNQLSAGTYFDRITAVQNVGDKLLIFRENTIYWVAGDGANELGENSTFSEPELLTDDIGCTNPRSILSTPVGVFFKSSKGIYLIDGGLSVSYVGAGVEEFNSEAIIDSSIYQVENLAIFVTSQRLICYDYQQQKWSVDTISGALSVAQWKSKTTLLKDGVVSTLSNLYVDNFGEVTPPNISMRLLGGWLKLQNIQGFARVYRLLILGRYYSAHTLTVKVYYDYSTSYVETYTITPDPAQGTYQFKIHLKQQKCQAIKVEIFETGTGRSLDLSGMMLEVGLKQGTAKINTARQY